MKHLPHRPAIINVDICNQLRPPGEEKISFLQWKGTTKYIKHTPDQDHAQELLTNRRQTLWKFIFILLWILLVNWKQIQLKKMTYRYNLIICKPLINSWFVFIFNPLPVIFIKIIYQFIIRSYVIFTYMIKLICNNIN